MKTFSEREWRNEKIKGGRSKMEILDFRVYGVSYYLVEKESL